MSRLDRVVLQVLGRSAGGIAKHVADLARSLDGAAGLKVEVAGPSGLPVRMPEGLHNIEVPDGPVVGHTSAVRRLRSLIRDRSCDVVHSHGLRAGIDSALAARGLDVPVMLTVHNLVHEDVAGRMKSQLYRHAEGLAVRSADHVFCVSEQIARHLRETVPKAAGKIEVLYLGVEPIDIPSSTDATRSDLGVPAEAPLVVTVSRLAPQKALHVLLEAVAQIEDVHLAILGEGPLEKELNGLSRSLGLAERVHFLGFIEDVRAVIAAADAFCLSSVWEGVPLAAQEAILLGIPVVATDVGGMNELIQDGRSGRLTVANDPGALREALVDVLQDPEKARTFAQEAQRGLERRFSRSRMLGRLTEIYKEGIRAD